MIIAGGHLLHRRGMRDGGLHHAVGIDGGHQRSPIVEGIEEIHPQNHIGGVQGHLYIETGTGIILHGEDGGHGVEVADLHGGEAIVDPRAVDAIVVLHVVGVELGVTADLHPHVLGLSQLELKEQIS